MKNRIYYILLILFVFMMPLRSYGSGMSDTVDMSGYIDMIFQGEDNTNDHTAFRQNHLSIFTGKRIDRWRFFSEVEFESAPKFDADGAQEEITGGGAKIEQARGEILVETAWIEYNLNDMFNLRTGVLLIPTYFRVNHYPSISLSTSNPLIDKQIFPSDIVGAMLYGTKYLKDIGLEYRLYVGNGSSDFQGKEDPNNNKAVGMKVVLHIPNIRIFDRLDIGGHYYRDTLKPTDEHNPGKEDKITGGEIIIEKSRFSLLSEYAHEDLRDKTGYYVQPSVNIMSNIIFFYRFDGRNLKGAEDDEDNPIKRRHTIGVNLRPLPEISLKAEVFGSIKSDDKFKGGMGSIVIFF